MLITKDMQAYTPVTCESYVINKTICSASKKLIKIHEFHVNQKKVLHVNFHFYELYFVYFKLFTHILLQMQMFFYTNFAVFN